MRLVNTLFPQWAAVSLSNVMLFALASGPVSAQGTAQDTIDRNLLERQQQDQDLRNRLDDATRNAPGIVLQPFNAPGSPAPPEPPPAQLGPSELSRSQLYNSQLQRQLQQQLQNQSLPGPVREQQNQFQMLQFQHEDQAQRLEHEIQSESARALPGLGVH
jgi:type IV secretory pathway VirB10-like protein